VERVGTGETDPEQQKGPKEKRDKRRGGTPGQAVRRNRGA
jgi:hypothetical protein